MPSTGKIDGKVAAMYVERDRQSEGWFVCRPDGAAVCWALHERDAHLFAAALDMFAELQWLAEFADIRSKDDSKVFARVNRGALRNIAERSRNMLALAQGPSS